MFLLSRRQAHAALAGGAAAAAWLAAAEIGSRRPVRVGALFLLSSAALAAVMAPVAGHRASVKATATEARFNNLLANGGRFGGDIYVQGDHHVSGTTHMDGGGSMGATLHFNQNHLDGLTEVNEDGTHMGIHAPLYMNGHDIFMQGGGGGGATVMP